MSTTYTITLAGSDSNSTRRKYVAAERAAGPGRITTTEALRDAATYPRAEAEALRDALLLTSGGYAWKAVPVGDAT